MKNSVELRQERATSISDANVMLELCKTEKRDFTEAEQVSYDGKMNLIDKLKKDIETVERQESLNAEMALKPKVVTKVEKEEKRGYSLFKAISGFMDGTLSGLEKELHDEAVAEARSAGRVIEGVGIPSRLLEKRTDVTQGTSAIAPTAVLGFQEALREASVFNRVGANILTGLSADTRLPITAKQSVGWAGEVANAADGGANFGKLDLSPIRVTSQVNISKQLLMQNGAGVQAAVVNDLGRATGQAIDDAMFKATNVTDAPLSVPFTSGVVGITPNSYTLNASIFDDFCLAESLLAEGEGLAGNLAYVANPSLMKDLKRSAQVAAVTVGSQGNLVNGYPTFYTNGCTKVARVAGTTDGSADFLFGDFSKLFIGMFGGLDITIDPYTRASYGEVKLVINQYIDWGLTQPGAFVKGTSITAPQ